MEGRLETDESEKEPETETRIDENIEMIVKKEKDKNEMSRVSSQSPSLPDAVLLEKKKKKALGFERVDRSERGFSSPYY